MNNPLLDLNYEHASAKLRELESNLIQISMYTDTPEAVKTIVSRISDYNRLRSILISEKPTKHPFSLDVLSVTSAIQDLDKLRNMEAHPRVLSLIHAIEIYLGSEKYIVEKLGEKKLGSEDNVNQDA